MLYVAVVEDNLGGVPFAHGIDVHLRVVGQVHGIVNAQLLPFLEFLRCIHFLPALVVDELILGSRHVGDREGRVLHYVVNHAAVAAVSEFPVPLQLEVGELAFGDDVAGVVGPGAAGLYAAIHGFPSVGENGVVVVAPLREVLPVEEQYPSLAFLSFRQHVVLGLTGTKRSAHCRQREQHQICFLHCSDNLGCC